MLLLALALQSLTAPPPPATPVRFAPRRPLSLTLLPDCRATPACGAEDPSARFRIDDGFDRLIDPKLDAVRGTGPSCGITGMPVCPKRARRMLQMGY